MVSGMIGMIGVIPGDSPRVNELPARSAGRRFGGAGGDRLVGDILPALVNYRLQLINPPPPPPDPPWIY